MNTKAIIDYAANDQGAEMRQALYSAIQDKVMAHIDAKKQEIAQNLIAPREEEQTEEQE
jgi:alpha-D-ribose 1-methylphosphonate 5-triphosphate synthase subunit PhnG